MIGTIEELEREIEQFQNNVAASGEMVQLLKEMVASIRQQNIDFEARTNSLLSKVNSLPATIEDSNSEMQEKIKGDVSTELAKALKKLSLEQTKYIQGLEITKQQIQNYIEQSKLQEQAFSERVNMLLEKIDGVPARIASDNEKMLERLKQEVDDVLSKRNIEFSSEQGKYLDSLQKTDGAIKECEDRLLMKYNEFVDTLDKMNLSNLYEQNVQLKNELSKRTTILMVISGVSLLLGIIGLIL